MRSLPEFPNLAFLRQEAKDALDSLRETEPGASLADAQRLLAEQYGYRTWTELKTEVERRRSSAKEAADPELAVALARAFGLGDVAGPMVPVSYDIMGAVWSLKTGLGHWSIRTIFDWMDTEHTENAFRLREAAIAAGIVAPRPVRSINGRAMEKVRGTKWCIDQWMDVGPAPTKPVSAEVAAQVGTVAGTVHGLGLPAPGPAHPWGTRPPVVARWNELLVAATKEHAAWAPLLESAMPAIRDLSKIDNTAPAEPMVLSNTPSPGGVRTGRSGRLIILDWDFTVGAQPSRALGSVLTQWVVGPADQVNVVAARALVQAYRATAPSPEPTLSMFSAAACGWLNYTAGRAAVALEANDPRERQDAQREVPDLLAHPLTTHKLERILDAIRD